MASIQKRVSKDGKVSYRAQVRRKGAVPLTATFERKTDAKTWADDREAEIRQKKHFPYAEAKKHTVADAIDRYLNEVLPRKPKSADQQTPQLTRWKKELGSVSLADLRPQIIAEARERIASDKVTKDRVRSAGSTNRYLAALSHVLTVAMKEWEWIDNNPAFALSKYKEPPGRIRFLSEKERVRLLDACKASGNKYLFTIVTLAIATGMRKDEILKLKWEHVDLKHGFALVYDTKNSEPRKVALTGVVLALVKNLAKDAGEDAVYLFPNTDGERPVDIRSAWDVARKNAKLNDFRFHDLRHTAASYLAMSGATLPVLADVLGHKSYEMVRRYAHLADSHVTAEVKKMNKKVFGS